MVKLCGLSQVIFDTITVSRLRSVLLPGAKPSEYPCLTRGLLLSVMLYSTWVATYHILSEVTPAVKEKESQLNKIMKTFQTWINFKAKADFHLIVKHKNMLTTLSKPGNDADKNMVPKACEPPFFILTNLKPVLSVQEIYP